MSGTPPPGAPPPGVSSSGPTHTGPGDQHIHYYGGGDGDARRLADSARGKAPRAVAEDELRWLRRRFIHPAGYEAAYDTLAARHTVLVDGAPGSGRRATARMLLLDLPRTGGRFLELPPAKEAEEQWLDPDQVGDADQLLLDMSGADDLTWHDAEARLSAFRKAVADRGAHLTVVLPRHADRRLSPEYAALRVPISRPPGLQLEHDLIKRYLRLAGLDPAAADPLPAVLREHLDRRPPLRDVAELARLLCEAGQAARPGQTFRDWCEAALAAVSDCGVEVDTLVKRQRRAPQRALLLSAAMLHGVRADTVHQASDTLLAAIGHPENTTSPLERQGLGSRLARIEAAQTDDGRVRFDRLRFDAAVRDHFWDNHPDLYGPLRTWVQNVLTLAGLTDEDREHLVARFAEQCCRTRRAEDLFALVESWTAGRDRGPSIRAAAQLLGHGVEDPRIGAECRARIYRWSTDGRLSGGLRKVLIGVCFSVLALRHPYAAAVRLHHLAAREAPGTEARDTLVELVLCDARLHAWMLARLAAPAAQRSRATDRALFLALAEPRGLLGTATPLLAEPDVSRCLTEGWRAVFAEAPPEEWRGPVRAWFDAACGDAPAAFRHWLLDILVAAGAVNGAWARLYRTARAWAREVPGAHPERGALPAVLMEKISRSQRGRSPRNEGTSAP
ncbi:hypothetical protein AB0E74_16935 [Streptomyces sp. NPDC030392]|uniref:nSTAND3 domain-containing NTPase n=1 Tax=Streptomyces sp. NPDC030392 TaxID=3155468 RepID=UPI0033F41E52